MKLSELEVERLRRLRAELEVAQLQLGLAQDKLREAEQRLGHAVQAVANEKGLTGRVGVDLETGTISAEESA